MGIKTPKEYREMEFRALLLELVRLYKPKVYVEVGVKKAYTFNDVAPLVKNAIGIDINPSCAQYIGINFPVVRRSYTSTEHKRFYCGTSEEYISNCLKVANPMQNEFIDFLFIDGDHNCESVLGDFYLLSPYVKTYTGLIFLHDTYPVKKELLSEGYCFNAWKAAREIRENFGSSCFEIVTLPGPWAGLSIIRKLHPVTNYHGWMDDSQEENCVFKGE